MRNNRRRSEHAQDPDNTGHVRNSQPKFRQNYRKYIALIYGIVSSKSVALSSQGREQYGETKAHVANVTDLDDQKRCEKSFGMKYFRTRLGQR